MNKAELDLVIAKTKEVGYAKWNNIKQHSGTPKGAAPAPKVFNQFATWCENYFNSLSYSKKQNNLRMLEAFLRAGKHMPTDIKNDNRRKADKLYEEIVKELK